MCALSKTFHRDRKPEPTIEKRKRRRERSSDRKKALETQSQAKRQRGTAMVRIEAELLTRLDTISGLTCSYCAHIKHNNSKGFSDEEYRHDNPDRICIKCEAAQKLEKGLEQTIFKIQGIPMFVCYGRCREVVALTDECTMLDEQDDLERRFCQRCWIRVGCLQSHQRVDANG